MGQRRPAAGLGAGRRLGRATRSSALIGETATSPAADTTISVSAPEELTVLMTGDQAEPSEPPDGRRTWTSAEPVARDVAVAAGEFTTAERDDGGRRPRDRRRAAGRRADADELADWTVEAIADLEQLLGPFPYETLTVALLPDYGGGIEYPSLILAGDARAASVLVHEVAHMWFYGMVGNSQFRDPWLDEAFATWAEAVVDPASGASSSRRSACPGDVGGAMDDFPNAGAVLPPRLRQGRRRAARGPGRGRRRRRSTPPSAATSTPPPGRIATPDGRRPRRSPTCPRRSPSSTEAGALDEDDAARAERSARPSRAAAAGG